MRSIAALALAAVTAIGFALPAVAQGSATPATPPAPVAPVAAAPVAATPGGVVAKPAEQARPADTAKPSTSVRTTGQAGVQKRATPHAATPAVPAVKSN